MKKILTSLFALTLCAAMLAVPAAAIVTDQAPADDGTPHVQPLGGQTAPVSDPTAPTDPADPDAVQVASPVLVWGTITWEKAGKSFLLKNDNEQNFNDEIIVHISDETYCLNAVDGTPVKADTLKDGDTVYAYLSPAMMLSLPPQSTALLLLTKIPADFAVPAYYQVLNVLNVSDSAITVATDQNTAVTVSAKMPATPYLTKNVVTYRDLIPGARFLAWTGSQGAVSKIMVFPYEGLPYADVEKDSAFYDAVSFVASSGIMQSSHGYQFGVSEGMTRADVVLALYRLAGSPAVTQSAPKFTDVQSGADYLDALTWAVGNQIVTGYADNTFRPTNTVSRQQFATFLYRWEQHQGGGFQGDWAFLLDYPDRDSISGSAYESVAWCSMKGILTGRADGTLAPAANVNRGAAAAMIQRYMTLEK